MDQNSFLAARRLLEEVLEDPAKLARRRRIKRLAIEYGPRLQARLERALHDYLMHQARSHRDLTP